MDDKKAVFLIIVQNYWGKGETLTDAIEALANSGHTLKNGDKYLLEIWDKTQMEDISVDEMGDRWYQRENYKAYSGMERYKA